MSTFDLSRLDGCVALVTGASRGIGAATAQTLEQAEADVWLAGLAYAFDTLQLDALYCEVFRCISSVLNMQKRFGFEVCDSSLSHNSINHDLVVLRLSHR